MIKDEIDKLIGLSKDKHNLLEKFYDRTKEQTRLLEEDDLEGSDKIILERSKLIEEIDRIDEKFVKGFESIKSKEGIETMEEIVVEKYDNLGEFKDIISKISALLKDISELDKNNMVTMKKNLAGVKSELRNVKDSKTAYKGYHHEEAGSMMIDERK